MRRLSIWSVLFLTACGVESSEESGASVAPAEPFEIEGTVYDSQADFVASGNRCGNELDALMIEMIETMVAEDGALSRRPSGGGVAGVVAARRSPAA